MAQSMIVCVTVSVSSASVVKVYGGNLEKLFKSSRAVTVVVVFNHTPSKKFDSANIKTVAGSISSAAVALT